ncbi:MAG: 30S ribosomal protein S4 [Dissulfurimicrobium sp.]|uniref:30S ribosomal protein S4 n=1 Tax=Dissulfurimicrobium TaxID=1769732 RepID=UPI001EDAA0A2|nr:30S ribosomal protein S4 [Dissulfurimicrobium hydrothermale]UKL14342.1 30S ribosomal protein S4 [Dissulfurimicrobium hydrothermale]
MARYIEARCRICRREGIKLFLKGERCLSDKCSFERRGYAPGQHGQMRAKISDYGVRLREKQRLRRVYGVQEAQFRGYFDLADRQKGVTGVNLLRCLERRLDNVVYRLGFAESRFQARQLVRHGFFSVNNKRVNMPSFLVSPGDVIDVMDKENVILPIRQSQEAIARRGVPEWLELDAEKLQGRVKSLPERSHITLPINEQLIVEFYSK